MYKLTKIPAVSTAIKRSRSLRGFEVIGNDIQHYLFQSFRDRFVH